MIESHAVFYLYIFDSKPLRERDIKLNMRYSSRMTLKLYTRIKFKRFIALYVVANRCSPSFISISVIPQGNLRFIQSNSNENNVRLMSV